MANTSLQDYLKAIFSLQAGKKGASTSSIAARLDISPASVTAMVKRLATQGLAKHSPYRGVTLTKRGTSRALEVIRHHRLLETYLHKTLGVPLDQIHAEAEVLEHAVSEDLEDRIAAALGNPTRSPWRARVGKTPQSRVAVGSELVEHIFVSVEATT